MWVFGFGCEEIRNYDSGCLKVIGETGLFSHQALSLETNGTYGAARRYSDS